MMLMSDNPRARSLTQLEKMDIRAGKVHRNLSVPSLIEIAVYRKEGNLSSTGAFSVKIISAVERNVLFLGKDSMSFVSIISAVVIFFCKCASAITLPDF